MMMKTLYNTTIINKINILLTVVKYIHYLLFVFNDIYNKYNRDANGIKTVSIKKKE